MNMENTNSNSSTVSKGQGVGSPTGNGSTSDDEEAQEEEPSSSNDRKNEENELDKFVRLWKMEIGLTTSEEKTSMMKKGFPLSNNETVEEMAHRLFLSGIQAENAGKLQDAISFYRRAIQLVPDIEFRISENATEYFDDTVEYEEENMVEENMSDDDDEELDNLVNKFQKLATEMGNTKICQPNFEQKASHISDLPVEIFHYILRWVVSEDLDLLSLEQISKVCRGFYICARDPGIWKLVCLRIWNANIEIANEYGGWRNMYIQRQHLSYNGVYISQTRYIRYGENSFQDTTYRPCHIVTYYRYLRFFPEGMVLMLTTTDDPYQIPSVFYKLRYRDSRHQNMMYGRYKVIGNIVMAILKKCESGVPKIVKYYRHRRQRVNPQESYEQAFHIELHMKNVKKGHKLLWNRYSIHKIYRNGQEVVSDIDLTPSNFPSFSFSRVKSYTAESVNPLT